MNWGNCDYKQLLKLKENIDRLQSMDMQKFAGMPQRNWRHACFLWSSPPPRLGNIQINRQKAAHSAVAGQPRAKPRQQRAARRMSKPMHKACRCSNRAATTTLRLSTRGICQLCGVWTPHTGGKGWVSGQYFLTLSEHELEKVAPKVLEKRLTELLREVFNV